MRLEGYGKCRQLFWTICPLSGQMQESIGLTWQFAVTMFPPAPSAEQLVQWGLNALAGLINKARLMIKAATLNSKSIFLLTLKSLFLPS